MSRIRLAALSLLAIGIAPAALAQPTPRPAQQQAPGPMALPEGWGVGLAQPAAINLVGDWVFQGTMYSAQVEGRFIFRADGTYNQFLRFINSSNYGGQIIQLWGNYAQQGNTLTLTGAGGQVTGGPRPEALCDLGSGACEPLNTRFDKTEIQVIDANTFKAKAVTAKRVTAAPSASPTPGR